VSLLDMRFAGAADAPAIRALIESAYRGDASRLGWTTEADLIEGDRTSVTEVASLIADPAARFLLAFQDKDLIGCALLRNNGGEGYFGMFAVRPGLQGGGYGNQIIACAEKAVRDIWNCNTMAMTVISLRSELIAWYERRGYRPVGTSPFPFSREPGAKRTDFHFVVLSKKLP
jgi:GNAT superfamily N-acetyltransferase